MVIMSDPLLMWRGRFGDDYTERNLFSAKVIKQREDSLASVFGTLPIDLIIEPGCGSGANLKALQELGYRVIGIEPNWKAISEAITSLRSPFVLLNSTCYQINVSDGKADLVLSAGLLIHIPEDRLNEAIVEMLRVSKKYLLIIEYYSEVEEELNYRGNGGMLWKRNWPEIFEQYPVTLVKNGYFDKSQGYDDCHWYLYQKWVNLL